jgi:hypothetical protein
LDWWLPCQKRIDKEQRASFGTCSPNLECQIHCSDTVVFRLYLVIIIQLLTN